MRVMGVDCGSQITGYGVVEMEDSGNSDIAPRASSPGELVCRAAGSIHLDARKPLPERLAKVFAELSRIMREHQPAIVAIEDVFYAANAKTALKLGHVRGVAMLAAAAARLPVAEYAPLAIKSAVVGYGRAEKHQVQMMVARLLKLASLPEPDAADALAIAICHLHTAATEVRLHHGGAETPRKPNSKTWNLKLET